MAEARPPAGTRGLEHESPWLIRRTPLLLQRSRSLIGALTLLDDADSPSGLLLSKNRRIPSLTQSGPELGGAPGEDGVICFLQEGSEGGGRRSELTSTFSPPLIHHRGPSAGEGASAWPPGTFPASSGTGADTPPPLTFTSAAPRADNL